MIRGFLRFTLSSILLVCLSGKIVAQENINSSSIRLNQIQLIGSHNSYKKSIESNLWQKVFNKDSLLAYSLQYEHPSLEEQLNLGLRSLELDVYLDPQGGKYSNPLGLKILKKQGLAAELYDQNGDLEKPGLKVFHIQDIDFRSNDLLFVDCLRGIKKWLDSNKNQVPIIITINAKDSKINFDGANEPILFGRKELESIDLEICSVFLEANLITPNFIQGKFSNLREAILINGWPLINNIRGKIMFVLDESGQKLKDYLTEEHTLNHKVMFVNAEEGDQNAAVMIINDPIKNESAIKNLVSKGYLVRTRADSETIEARRNDYTRFAAAVKSNAQIISTDYYLLSKLFKSSYQVIFKDKSYSRINSLLEK